MKYYTKEWYQLMQEWGMDGMFKKIPDGEYNTASIKALYNKKLKNRIAEERRRYNQEPDMFHVEEFLTEENFTPDLWIYFDEESGQEVKASSVEDVIRREKEAYRKAYEQFINRPPFDKTETVELFEENYKSILESGVDEMYPDWIINSVDNRLLALDCIPESAYIRYKNELRDKKKQWNKINKAAEKVLNSQRFPERVEDALCLHDADLLSLRKHGKNVLMIVKKDGIWPDDLTPYRRVIFINAKVIEKENGLKPTKCKQDGIYFSNIRFLYHEIYEENGVYEAHMMFDSNRDLRYFTVKCNDIVYSDGISF